MLISNFMVIKLCMKRHFLMKDMWSIDLLTILWEKGLRFYIWNLVSINLSIFLIVIFFKWQLVSKCFKLYCENMDNGWNKQNWQWKYIIKFHPLFIKFPHPYVEVGILIHCPTFWGSWANFMRFFIHDAISSNVFLKEMGASSFNFHHQMLSIPYIFINFATSFSTFILIDFQPLWNSLQGLN